MKTPVSVVEEPELLLLEYPLSVSADIYKEHYDEVMEAVRELEPHAKLKPALHSVILQYRKLAVTLINQQEVLVANMLKHCVKILEETLVRVAESNRSKPKEVRMVVAGVLGEVESTYKDVLRWWVEEKVRKIGHS